MYINVVVFLQENDDVEGYAADYISLLLLHFSQKRCTGHGETRLAQRRHLVGTLLCLMYINVVVVYKKMMTLT